MESWLTAHVDELNALMGKLHAAGSAPVPTRQPQPRHRAGQAQRNNGVTLVAVPRLARNTRRPAAPTSLTQATLSSEVIVPGVEGHERTRCIA